MSKFAKGVSGNPGGRPKKNDEFVQAARDQTMSALETLSAIMTNKRAPAAARVAAAREMLDRGWGRPTQDVRLETELTATINAQAFVRASTYADWLEMRLCSLGERKVEASPATANSHPKPLLLLSGRSAGLEAGAEDS